MYKPTKKSFLIAFTLLLMWQGIQAQQVFNLTKVLENTRNQNKSLKMSENEVKIASEKNKEVKSNLLPKIKANGDYKYYFDLPTQLMPAQAFNPMAPEWQFKPAQFGVPHNINANLQIVLPVYNPELYGNMKKTKIAKELAQLKYDKTKEQILYDVSNLFYNAQIIKAKQNFIQGNIINTKKLLNNLKLLQKQGLAKGSDVDKISLQLQQLQSQAEQIQANYTQILDALKFYMGMPLDKQIDVEIDIDVSDKTFNYQTDESLDYKITKTKNKLIKSEISTLKRSRLPSLSLYGSYGSIGYGYDEEPHDFLDFYDVSFVGAKLSIPIFNGTTISRKIKQKKYELKNSEMQMELVAEQKSMSIKNARLKRQVSKNSMSATKAQVDLAQKIYDQSILEQKQGLASLTDIIMADNALRQAQQAYLQAEIDFAKADLELKKLTGNLK